MYNVLISKGDKLTYKNENTSAAAATPTTTVQNQTSWFPEIVYSENNSGVSSNIPFIEVPNSERMPNMLFIFEARKTEDIAEDENGTEGPIMDLVLHQYADMELLKRGLKPADYDQVRAVLGLKPMADAVATGQKIGNQISNNIRIVKE